MGAGTTGGSTMGAGAGIGIGTEGGTASGCGGAMICNGATGGSATCFDDIAADFGATLPALTGFNDSLL